MCQQELISLFLCFFKRFLWILFCVVDIVLGVPENVNRNVCIEVLSKAVAYQHC